MFHQRGLLARALDACLGFFMAAGLLYLGVHLLMAILPWLIAAGAVLGVGGVSYALLRWRRERW